MSSQAIKIDGVGQPVTKLMHVPVKDIRENNVMLRPVDRENEEFVRLAASVKANGVFTAISVREIVDPENPSRTIYGIVDGLQRWTAAKDAGHETIPAQVISIADGDVLEAQILANIHKVETKPAQYSKALKQFLASNPTITSRELASRLNQSETWLANRLSLNQLHKDVATLVDEGKIVLANAFALTLLPEEDQVQYVEQAMSETAQMFAPSMKKIAGEIRKAKFQGREVVHEFVAQSHIQKKTDIESEQANPNIVKSLLISSNVTTPLEGAQLALAWVLHLDPLSIASAKAKFEAKKKEQEDAKAQRKKEREDKKLAEAQATAASIGG